MRGSVWAVFVFAALGGCFSDEPGPPPAQSDPATGMVAPRWSEGDWWTYAFTSDYYDVAFEVTLVVARADGNGTLVGIPVDEWTVLPIVYHVPPTGRVNANLSFDVHGYVFDPFRFPLVAGKQWDTRWASVPITLRANLTDVALPNGTAVPGAVVSNRDLSAAALATQQRLYEAVYAPAVGWFVHSERSLPDGRVLERFQLKAWGHGYEGPVRAIENTTLLYVESRTPPNPANGDLIALEGSEFALDTFPSTGSPARLALALEAGQAPGRYYVEIVSPSGRSFPYEYTAMAGDTKLHGVFLETENEAGTWSVRYAPGGTGFVIADATGFDAWDHQSPSSAGQRFDA